MPFSPDPYDTLGELMKIQAAHWNSELIRYRQEAAEAKRAMPLTDVDSAHLAICAHLHSEIDELVRCVNWKVHQQTKRVSKAAIVLECVDTFKFLLTLLAIHQVEPHEFLDAFHAKTLVVRRRADLEALRHRSSMGRLGPTLVCDLDGVVCARDTALLAFAAKKGAGTFQSTKDLKGHLGQVNYEKLKDAFYEAGCFKTATVVEAAANSLRRAHAAGVPVIFVTARDIKRFPTIEIDTYEWLDNHNIPYDAVVFGGEKERAIAGLVPKDSIAIDDEEVNVVRLRYVCDAELYYMNDILDISVAALVARRKGWSNRA